MTYSNGCLLNGVWWYVDKVAFYKKYQMKITRKTTWSGTRLVRYACLIHTENWMLLWLLWRIYSNVIFPSTLSKCVAGEVNYYIICLLSVSLLNRVSYKRTLATVLAIAVFNCQEGSESNIPFWYNCFSVLIMNCMIFIFVRVIWLQSAICSHILWPPCALCFS